MKSLLLMTVVAATPYVHQDTVRTIEKSDKLIDQGGISVITAEYQDHFQEDGTLYSKLLTIRKNAAKDEFVADQINRAADRAFEQAVTINDLTKVFQRFEGTPAAEKAKYRLGVIYLDRGLIDVGLRLLGDSRDPRQVPRRESPLLRVGPTAQKYEFETYKAELPAWDGLYPEVHQNDFRDLETGVLISSRTGVYFSGPKGVVPIQKPQKTLPTFDYNSVTQEWTKDLNPPMVDDAPAQFVGIDKYTAIFSTVKDGRLYVVDENGKKIWESKKAHKGIPVVFNKKLVCIVDDQFCLSLDIIDPATGETEWSQPFAFTESKNHIFPLVPTISPEGIAYCPTNEGAIAAVDLPLRRLCWFRKYPQTSEFKPDLPRLTFNRTIVNDRVWTIPYDSEMLLCFSLTGDLLHSIPRQEIFELCRSDSGVIAIDGFSCSLIDNDSKTVWRTYVNRVVGSVAEDRQRVLIPCQKHVAAIDKGTGKRLGDIPVSEKFTLRAVDGRLVYCGQGAIYTAGTEKFVAADNFHPLHRESEPVAYLEPLQAEKQDFPIVNEVEVTTTPVEIKPVLSEFSLPKGLKYRVTQIGTTTENRLIFTETATGKRLAVYEIDGRLDFPNWSPVDPLDVIPIATKDMIIGLNPMESNTPIWKFRLDSDYTTFGPYGEDHCVFYTRTKLYNINSRTGKLLWTREIPGFIPQVTCLFGDSRYLVFRRTDTLYSIYDMQTGEEINSGRLPDLANDRTHVFGSKLIMENEEEISVWSAEDGIIWSKRGDFDVSTPDHWMIVSADKEATLVNLRTMKESTVAIDKSYNMGCLEYDDITIITNSTIEDDSRQNAVYSNMMEISSFNQLTAIKNNRVLWKKNVGEMSTAGVFRGVLFMFYRREESPQDHDNMYMMLLRATDGKALFDEKIPSDNYISIQTVSENVVVGGVNTSIIVKMR